MRLSHSGYGDWKNVMEAGSLGLSGNSSTAVSCLLEMPRECFPLPASPLSLSVVS